MVKAKANAMPAARFVAGIRALGYTLHNAERLLGVPRRTIYRIARGESPVPMTAAKLLDCYERFGIPEEHRL